MWHHRIGLSEAGNDFFVLISALNGIRVVLVIRPFITLPARHSAVWVNAISPDSHNYPKIERGRKISLAMALWVREFREIHREGGKGFFSASAVCLCSRVVCLDSVNICDVHFLQQKWMPEASIYILLCRLWNLLLWIHYTVALYILNTFLSEFITS